jgi:uncharacterized phage-associated protein
MLMRMRFNEAKATQAAARLLRNRGGRMSYMKLVKLLYLADREALARWGRPISTDTYVSMKHGPVLSQVLNLITEGEDPSFGTTVWAKHISEPDHFDVILKEEPSGDLLSEAEDELLDEIFKNYGHMNRWALVDFVHKLPEWKDPDGSAFPIEYADILRAQNKKPNEIRAIENELQSLSQLDRYLAAR